MATITVAVGDTKQTFDIPNKSGYGLGDHGLLTIWETSGDIVHFKTWDRVRVSS